MEQTYRLLVVRFLAILSCTCFCTGSNFGPKNITRTAGANDEYVRCRSHPFDATPFWKINGIVYYYSEVPLPFVVSKDGRDIVIPIVELSLNGTSFQCFIPSTSGGDLISSSLGVLTVTENGHPQVPRYNNGSQSKLAIAHQMLFFSYNLLKLAWRIINSESCTYYDLIIRYDCDANSQSELIVNKTKDNTIVLLRRDLIGISTYFNVTSYNEEGDVCEDQHLEQFQFSAGIVTDYLQLCVADHFESCSVSTPICIDIPPLNGRETLILALPFLPVITGLEEDLLCPVHPFPGERCVDLFSCNRFRESAYANSITICRRANNNNSSLEMCFHNITTVMNGTMLHFFYSKLHCGPQFKSSRTYINSMQLLTTTIGTDMIMPSSSAPPASLPPHSVENFTNITLFSVGFFLTFTCGLFLGAGGSCVVYCFFQKWKRSSHKGEEMNISVTNNPAYEVVRVTQ